MRFLLVPLIILAVLSMVRRLYLLILEMVSILQHYHELALSQWHFLLPFHSAVPQKHSQPLRGSVPAKQFLLQMCFETPFLIRLLTIRAGSSLATHTSSEGSPLSHNHRKQIFGAICTLRCMSRPIPVHNLPLIDCLVILSRHTYTRRLRFTESLLSI